MVENTDSDHLGCFKYCFLLFSQGQYVKMACSRLGSRVLEAIWNSASVNHRQSIAQELGNAIMTHILTLVEQLVCCFFLFCFFAYSLLLLPC